MKYIEAKVVFSEVPDEITLAINITNCPVGCPGCHSPYLTQDIGQPLDRESLDRLIRNNPGITCVSFMGGDAEPQQVAQFSAWVHDTFPRLKTCWYSGRQLEQAASVLPHLDYIKVGPYIDEYGPLESPLTNQRFYSVSLQSGKPQLTDITGRFQKKFTL